MRYTRRRAEARSGSVKAEHSTEAKSTADSGVPHSEAMGNLSEREKKALELQEHADHETGKQRERLQRAAAEKAK